MYRSEWLKRENYVSEFMALLFVFLHGFSIVQEKNVLYWLASAGLMILNCLMRNHNLTECLKKPVTMNVCNMIKGIAGGREHFSLIMKTLHG